MVVAVQKLDGLMNANKGAPSPYGMPADIGEPKKGFFSKFGINKSRS